MLTRRPSEMGGPGGLGTTEQLFAAGYARASIQHGALAGAVEPRSHRVAADRRGSHRPARAAASGSQAALDLHAPGIDPAKGCRAHEARARTCPYSRATRGNIDVTLSLRRADRADHGVRGPRRLAPSAAPQTR